MAKRRRVRTDGSPRLCAPDARHRHWRVVWSQKGRSKRLSTGTSDEALARRFFTEWQAALARSPEVFTINDICDAYYADRVAKPVLRPENIAQRLKPIRKYFGPGPASTVTRERVRAYIAARRKDERKPAPGAKLARKGKVQDATIDTELRALRAALKWAEKGNWFGEHGRAPHVETVGGGHARQRYLMPSEVERLVAALQSPETYPHTRTIVMIALMTAQRGGAIKELRWSNVDFDRNIIWFPPARSRLKSRVNTPMQPALAAHLLHARAGARSEWVVEWQARPVASVRKSFRALIQRAGLKDVGFHDLRRTAASLAVQRGASFAEVAALLGDDEAVVRRHYAMFDPQFLSGILHRIDAIAYAPVARMDVAPVGEDDQNPNKPGS